LEAERSAGPDLAALSAEVEAAQAALTQAEAASQAASGTHAAARQGLEAARVPLAEAERRANRLETEAKTIAKMLAGDTKNLWPPVMDLVTVANGYEKALGAALGDDLDAPLESSAPMHWSGIGAAPTDPPLPEGVEALAAHVTAPPELTRRLAQIGV